MLLLNPRRTRTNMKLLQLVWIFLLTLCGQSAFIKIQVKEDDEAILDCSFGRNIENGAFDWKKDVDKSNEDVFWYSDGQTDPGKDFRGRVSYFPDQLRSGNASIKITKAKTSDSGTYTCYHAITQKEVKSTISLTVGAAPRPFITLHKTNNGMLLQCEVLGAFPKPEVQWWDSDGNVLAVGDPQIRDGKVNKYDTVLNVTVNKIGDYRCVSTQDDIHHQIYTKTHVIPEEKSSAEGFGVGTIVVAVVVAVLITAVVVGVLAFVIVRRSKSKAGGPTPTPAASSSKQEIL